MLSPKAVRTFSQHDSPFLNSPLHLLLQILLFVWVKHLILLQKPKCKRLFLGCAGILTKMGAFSTQKNTDYTYQTAGEKRVRYVVKSEFGCIDSTQIKVRVKESPEAQFNYDQLCLLSPTRFTNTTQAVSGALWQLQWQLNDVNQGSQSAFSTTWNDTGNQKIALKVSLDNGCVYSVVRMVQILNEVDVDFDFEVLCAGDSVRFDNKSIPLNGVTFTWSCGGGESRESVNTRLVFDAVDSTSVPVLLRASALN